MREKIYRYLESAGEPVAAGRILQEALGIQAPNDRTADRILLSMLRSDSRFRSNRRGFWQLVQQVPSRPEALAFAFLHIEAGPGTPPRHFRGAVRIAGPSRIEEYEFYSGRAQSHSRVLRGLRPKLNEHVLVLWRRASLKPWNAQLRRAGCVGWSGPVLSLEDLANRILLPSVRRIHLEEIADTLGLSPPDPDRPTSVARFMEDALDALRASLPEGPRTDPEALLAWVQERADERSPMRTAIPRAVIDQIPDSPGVYIMRNQIGDVIYVGKAARLRRRVRSYFRPGAAEIPRVRNVLAELHSIEYSMASSDLEALLLEMRLILEFRPFGNLQTSVHERRHPYGRAASILLLIPEEEAGRAHAFLLHKGSLEGPLTLRLEQNPSRKIETAIRRFFYGRKRRSRSERESWERELVSSWLHRYRKRVNYIDVDEAGSYEELLRLLTRYLFDPDRLSRKVIYR